MSTIKEIFRVKRKDGYESRICKECREPIVYLKTRNRGENDHDTVHVCETCGQVEGETLPDPLVDDSDFLKRV